MTSTRMSSGGWRVVLTGLLLLLLLAAPALQAAECPRVTDWSNEDASYFPVPQLLRVDRSNTPGPSYYLLDGTQEKQVLVTTFSLSAGPSLTSQQRFSNRVGVSLASFANAAEAEAMFRRERELFAALNPFRWHYNVLYDESFVLAYYFEQPGNRRMVYLAVHRHTIVRIELRSVSDAESVLREGHAEMGQRAVQARRLIDDKCGASTPNSPPAIYLRQAPGELRMADFQQEMAMGVVLIGAYDADGIDDVDWSSFRVSVAGVDKTGHFLEVVARLAADRSQQRVIYEAWGFGGTAAIYGLRLDPDKLMSTHNLFNIPWNGEWPITLRICDRRGACGSKDYRPYFGPFLVLRGFQDTRCGTSSSSLAEFRFRASWGNNGHTATANFYVALAASAAPWTSWTSDYATLALGIQAPTDLLQWFDASWGPLPVFPLLPVELPTGAAKVDVALTTPTWVQTKTTLRQTPFGAGTYTLLYGAIDIGQGVYRFDTERVTLCAPR